VRQVYGILFGRAGRVLLQDDQGRCNLPGGTPEPVAAGLPGTLERECTEESQVRVSDAGPAGYQLVEEDGEVYAQARALPNTPAACANVSLNDSDDAACPSPACTRASSTTASMRQA